jgi:propanol-preferring alcohol dehydrogenase
VKISWVKIFLVELASFLKKRMKALVLEKPQDVKNKPLKFIETETPQPSEDEVLIQVFACGVCRTDLHICEGELPMKRDKIIPGHQVVGRVVKRGEKVSNIELGSRVGVAWLNRTCRSCVYCNKGKENLCENADFTGWSVNGGFAEYIVAPSSFTYSIPEGFADLQAAPLLCAGIIGYRALRLTGITDWAGVRLGIYGFGAAGHICIQIAKARGADVYVATRDRSRHQALAEELGAVWVGDTFSKPPVMLDASIVFAPAGEIVPAALQALDKGGSLVLGGIYMSPIPEFEYKLLYGERVIRSVANNTRKDGEEFLQEAAKIGVKTHVEIFPLEKGNEALIALKTDAIRGAAVLKV